MSAEGLFLVTRQESADIISVRAQLLETLRDPAYRRDFVRERVRSSVALQIRALREQRNKMTQKQLGDALDMAQTWVSKLENPEYGKMTVSTLLRLAEVFDTDLEIKFRPFSTTIDRLPRQTEEYFTVPSFQQEFQQTPLSETDLDVAFERLQTDPVCNRLVSGSAEKGLERKRPESERSALARCS